MLEKGEWKEASDILSELEEYQNSYSLNNFALANIEYETADKNTLVEENYMSIFEYLDNIPVDYKGELTGEIKEFKDKVQEEKLEEKDKKVEEFINIAIDFIEKNDFKSAMHALDSIEIQNDIWRNIYNYAYAFYKYENPPAFEEINFAEYLDPYYDGPLSGKIEEFALKLFNSKDKWIKKWKIANELKKYEKDKRKDEEEIFHK